MHTRSLALLALVTALTLTAGCGGGGGGGSTASDGPFTGSLSEFCVAYASAGGQVEAGCSPVTAQYATASAVKCREIIAAGAEHRIAFDPDAAGRCLAEVKKVTCADLATYLPTAMREACTASMAGLVENGGECTMDGRNLECAHGYCEATACNTPGHCRAYAAAGERCDDMYGSPRCPPGQNCVGDLATSHCVAEPAPGTLGADCDRQTPCTADLYCQDRSTCAPRLGPSGACWSDDECRADLFCHGRTGNARGQCVAFVRVGGTCTPGEGRCIRGAFCGDDGRCQDAPQAGSACGPTSHGESRDCLAGWCKLDTGATVGTCMPYIDLGQSCAGAPSGACGGFATCANGTCARLYCEEE